MRRSNIAGVSFLPSMFNGLFALLVWLMFATSAQANNCVAVTGVASMDGVDRAYARQMAIRNGLELASMQNNLHISARSDTDNFQLQNQASRFTTRSKIQRFGIMDEYADEELKQYEVELNVCLTEDPSACGHAFGAHYQNRVVIAPAVIENSREANDISNLITGYQNELFRRLKESGYNNLDLIDYAQSTQPGNLVTPNLDPDVLRPIQDQTGGQFLLMSVVRSVASQSENKGFMDGLRNFYGYDSKKNRRYVEIDWYLVDLNKHRIVKQQREGFEVRGDVRVGRDRPFGTAAFFKTDTGQAFNALLNQQTERLYQHLNCELLETEIIDVRNGEYVLFLSEESGVQVGDQLSVYQRTGNPVRFQGRNLGMDETPSGFLKITRILPKFAVGELVAQNGRVQIGDVVRSW
ncbi:hypothetical protein [Thiomicrospira sp.]|uniref:hypothetical protein n=1 Tax=Thiomicrospira sp. TaxID=935 RepID=UPI002F94A790